MLDLFTVFTRGGLVLWSYSVAENARPAGDPVSALVSAVLLERNTIDSFTLGNYTMRWYLANQQELVFVAVHQKTIQLPYLEALLQKAAQAFIEKYTGDLTRPGRSFAPFTERFETLWREVQQQAKEKKAEGKKPRSFFETEKGKKLIKEGKATAPKPKKKKEKEDGEEEEEEEDEEEEEGEQEVPEETKQEEGEKKEDAKEDGGQTSFSSAPSSPSIPPAEGPASPSPSPASSPVKEETNDAINIDENKKQFLARMASRGLSKKKIETVPKDTIQKKGSKKMQTWGQGSKEELKNLNFSDAGSAPAPSGEDAVALGAKEKIDLYATSRPVQEEEEEAPKSGGLLSFFSSFTNSELTEAALAPVMERFRSHLIAKNVAQDIADSVCNSVKAGLLGKTHSSFKRLATTVREAMEEALTRILTPKRTIDVLREIGVQKAKGKPYSIVFVGVNGVGKSTTLAKVCSWLLQNNLKVMIAACDTFRSGAVEQLQVHAKNLEVPLHHRGYGKDAASIAFEGLQRAQREGYDVVLIDTAGRMQDNEPLMRALAKLVGLNEPNLVLFVGEALVGNDSVDQLSKFNRALEEFSTGQQARGIDGIILTKFDTVDEKVGAAISMVYATGMPIVFTGVGQKYSDLRVLDVARVVQILMRGQI